MRARSRSGIHRGQVHEQLSRCLEKDEQGRLRMTITLPDPAQLANMSEALARLMGFAQQRMNGETLSFRSPPWHSGLCLDFSRRV